MAKMIVVEKIPDWLKALPADAGLSPKEVACAPGYQSNSAVSMAEKRGEFLSMIVSFSWTASPVSFGMHARSAMRFAAGRGKPQSHDRAS